MSDNPAPAQALGAEGEDGDQGLFSRAARLVQGCKSAVAPAVNTPQQKLQVIIVECFIAVINSQCSSPPAITR